MRFLLATDNYLLNHEWPNMKSSIQICSSIKSSQFRPHVNWLLSRLDVGVCNVCALCLLPSTSRPSRSFIKNY